MAKGNMLLGYSRGSVGDVTFYRSGGSQRSRARNRNPNNPRTEKQQTQRSRFANAVKFYKQVTTNFFRFAYEDKKVNESDYNAFMRHNTLRSGFIGAQASKIANFPAFGFWEVTSGSLPTIVRNTPPSSSTTEIISFNVGSSATSDEWDEASTIGDVSNLLINKSNNRYRVGDILTVLVYVVKPSSGLPAIEGDFVAESNFMQIVLDPNDTTSATNFKCTCNGITFSVQWSDDGMSLAVSAAETADYGASFVQAAAIHSRNTDAGLLVSTQDMESNNNDAIVTAALATSGTYYNSVIADWDASANAILQGQN